MTTDTAKDVGSGIRLVRRLMGMNLGLVALQALSAGFFLSGFDHSVTAHASGARVLQLGALIQAVTAIVLWRQRRVPGWVAGFSIGLFAIVLLEVGLGHTRRYWLHVPLGVGLFGWLVRQVHRVDGSYAVRTRPANWL